jgi:hypothetical protein
MNSWIRGTTIDIRRVKLAFPITGYASVAQQRSIRRAKVTRRMPNVRAFPISRQAAVVRDAAAILANLHGDAAVAYWRATARELLSSAIERGSDEEHGRKEVRRFFDAVQVELQAALTYVA